MKNIHIHPTKNNQTSTSKTATKSVILRLEFMLKFYVVLFIFLSSFGVRASHIIGGDIYYDYLGNNQYRFFITLYRDCNSTGAEYDMPLKLSVYRTQSNQLHQNVDVTFPGAIVLPNTFNNPCATPPNNLCVQRAIYQIVLTLPPIQGGYTVSYQRCCRGPNITNLVSPDDTGLTLTTQVPGLETNAWENSSPRFTNYPPILLCNNDQLNFDHAATDPDGDQLVYSLVTPFSGATANAPAPQQAPPPPYFPVNWETAYSAQQPLGPGSSTVINANTGMLVVNPNMVGLFVVGVRVQEYRNGVLIGQTVRDFLFRVFNCNITLSAILPTQEQLPTFVNYCQGLTVNFVNNSYGGSAYAWDFGVPNTTSDVSSALTPSFTYPTSGTYNVRLIVNPGANCTDTAYMTVTVNEPFTLSWQAQDSVCITNNNLNFTSTSSNPSAALSWQFPQTASQATATGSTVNNINFNQPGFHTVRLNGTAGDCVSSFVDSIYIFGTPTSVFQVPNQVQCIGLTVAFRNFSTNSSNYFWDFGVPGSDTDQSSVFEPSYTYSTPGTYNVSLIAGSTGGCMDTSSQTIQVNEALQMSFVHSDSLCLTSGLFDFDATVSGPANTQFLWNFGPTAIPQTATTVDVEGVQYTVPGVFPVYLVGSHNGCRDSVKSNVFVYGEPSIAFDYVKKLQCAPSTATFVNLSETDAPAIFTWKFGDSSTAFEGIHASHVYNETGVFSVTLTMITLAGCLDTLSLTLEDIVTVHPKPIAGFQVNPSSVDICNSEVEFIDQSIDATGHYYFLQDRTLMTTEPNFTHNYTISGADYPMQVVVNSFGCKDSTVRTVYVEPFVLYVPNTFVPDGNNVNEYFKAVTAFDIDEWELRIFNRWGELLFESFDLDEGWDGNFNGNKCQDGTYLWVARYKSCDQPGIWKRDKGFVNLLR